MRKILGFVAALAGGYLLWSAFKFGRVLLILQDQRFDGTMLVIAGVMAAIGLGLVALGWYLFSDPVRRPPSPPPAPPQP